MSSQKYVCVDLDGTIAHYKKWEGETKFGDPIEGVQAALGKLQSEGWVVIVYTTRGNEKLIENYLQKHSIPFDYINKNPDQPQNALGGKPYADAYIDDRGIQFNGNWQATVDEVLHFSPWELRSGAHQGDEYRKQAIDFLARDYGEAFSQLRAYDTQIWEITKFSFLQLLTSIGAGWAVFALANSKDAPSILVTQWIFVTAVILIISFIFSLLAVQYILRIRVYFAVTARYINDHRNFFLSTTPLGFGNQSGYYTNSQYPKAFDAGSTQLLSTYTISLVSSFVFGVGLGLLAYYLGISESNALIFGSLVWFLTGILTIGYSVYYLKAKSDKSTNVDVFGLKQF